MDTILKLLALIVFVVFLGVLAYHVPHPDLIVVLLAVTLLAVYDFFLRPVWLRRRHRE